MKTVARSPFLISPPVGAPPAGRPTRLFGYMLPYKGKFALGMLLLVLSSAAFMAFPWVAGKLLDAANHQWTYTPAGHRLSINELGAALLAVIVLQGVFSFGRVFFFTRVSVFAVRDLRQALYKKLLLLPLSYFDTNRVGAIMSRLTADVSLIQETFSLTLSELLRQGLILVIGVALIIASSAKLSVFMLGTFPVLIAIASVFGRGIRRFSKLTQDELSLTNVIVEETLQAIQTVKAFANELFEVKRYNASLDRAVHSALKSNLYRGAFVSFLIVGLFGGLILVLWRGAQLVDTGEMSHGQLVSFIIYTSLIGSAAGGLAEMYGKVQSTLGASVRVLEILAETPEPVHRAPAAAAASPVPGPGALSFQRLGFAYPTRPDMPVLKDLTFRIAPGERVALVGPSGAGKSTLTQLLLQFYELGSGKIQLDGHDVQDYDLTTLRRHIGIVPQETVLFGGTIRENIAYGDPAASEAALIRAARQANAWEFITSFPDGLDTVVGERGVKLSGGQRQRIAIARVILKNPAILLLDEATSALDSESERLVQGAMDELMKNRTSIVIAHRLSTVRKVDKILVIDGGRVAEQGTHEELLAEEHGRYRNLLKLQLEIA